MSFCRYFMPLAVLAAMACGFSGAQAASAHQPYAGQQQRTIKALSAGDISGYLKGKGMGLAKSAELNHYPGPLHLRQLADEVKLTAEQRAAIATIEAAMKAEARRLGRIILGKEASLDALFADGTTSSGLADRLRLPLDPEASGPFKQSLKIKLLGQARN